MDGKIQQSSKLVMDAKEKYFSEQGKKLLDPSLSAKKYWSILNNFLQKKNKHSIPPLWENGIFVSDCAENAKLFNNFFASQCTPPPPPPWHRFCLTSILIKDKIPSYRYIAILGIIRSIDPIKSSGWDRISSRMLKICDSSIVKP